MNYLKKMKGLVSNHYLFVWISLVMIGTLAHNSYAQKPNINLLTYKDWPTITTGQLSNSGNFGFYIINNPAQNDNTLIIKSFRNNRELKVIGVNDAQFSEDSKFLIGEMTDTLFVLNLGKYEMSKISDAVDLKTFTLGNNQMIAYKATTNNSLVIKSLNDNLSVFKSIVKQYSISPNGKFIAYSSIIENAKKEKREVMYICSLSTKRIDTVFEGGEINKIIWDKEGQNLAFITTGTNGYEIWHYKINAASAVEILTNDSYQLHGNRLIDPANFRFMNNSGEIFFSLVEKNKPEKKENSSGIIWSYQDSFLRSYHVELENKYLSTINIESKNVKQLISNNQRIYRGALNPDQDSILIVESNYGREDEPFIVSSKSTYSVCFTKTGVVVPFEENRVASLKYIYISPRGNYIVYYDQTKRNYFSYNVHTNQKVNITRIIPESILRYDRLDFIDSGSFPAGFTGWMKDRDAVLLNGTYNVWLVDLLGKDRPINITKGKNQYGKFVYRVLSPNLINTLKWKEPIILTAFDVNNKNFGYFKTTICDNSNLIKLSIAPDYIQGIDNVYSDISSSVISKAKYSKTYLIRKERVDQAPNLFITEDFKTFKMFSNNQPQKKFNWLKSEIHHYVDDSTQNYEGVLYKPENFDSAKKYPIILNYYTEKSNLLNHFPGVDLPVAEFSISTAVSNGYLVYLPNIESKTGYSGEGALNSVVTAVNYLSQFKWVDTSKVGLIGHSFGGFETNYIITHSNRFKAAISAAGVTDFISQANSIWGFNGLSKQSYYKTSSPKMGVSLMEDSSVYIRNSPIFYAKNVCTPLLLVHNSGDQNVPFEQTRQFFILLRSLGRKVWWLNYPTEGHVILEEKNKLDYNTKVFEFFDHYLKGKEKSSWMSDHI